MLNVQPVQNKHSEKPQYNSISVSWLDSPALGTTFNHFCYNNLDCYLLEAIEEGNRRKARTAGRDDLQGDNQAETRAARN